LKGERTMTKEQALRIIENEQLKNYSLGEERYHRENELGICKEKGLWKVYATDERASIVTGSEVVFENESDAFDNFIKRLRAAKKFM